MWVMRRAQCGRGRLGFALQTLVCLLEWNMAGFSVQGGVSWETLKARAARELSQQQLQSTICGFCHQHPWGQAGPCCRGWRDCLAQSGAAVTQL